MKPYFQDELVTLYHGDCLEVTEWLQADVLVTDPPYGMGYESNMNRLAKRGVPKVGRPVLGDADTTARDAVLEMWRGRPALVFGKWTVQRPASTRMRLIWDKRVHGMGESLLPQAPRAK